VRWAVSPGAQALEGEGHLLGQCRQVARWRRQSRPSGVRSTPSTPLPANDDRHAQVGRGVGRIASLAPSAAAGGRQIERGQLRDEVAGQVQRLAGLQEVGDDALRRERPHRARLTRFDQRWEGDLPLLGIIQGEIERVGVERGGVQCGGHFGREGGGELIQRLHATKGRAEAVERRLQLEIAGHLLMGAGVLNRTAQRLGQVAGQGHMLGGEGAGLRGGQADDAQPGLAGHERHE
jgi:hypothetical protein